MVLGTMSARPASLLSVASPDPSAAQEVVLTQYRCLHSQSDRSVLAFPIRMGFKPLLQSERFARINEVVSLPVDNMNHTGSG